MMDQRREISLFFAIRPTIRNNLNAAFYRRDTDWKKRRKKVVASKPLWCRETTRDSPIHPLFAHAGCHAPVANNRGCERRNLSSPFHSTFASSPREYAATWRGAEAATRWWCSKPAEALQRMWVTGCVRAPRPRIGKTSAGKTGYPPLGFFLRDKKERRGVWVAEWNEFSTRVNPLIFGARSRFVRTSPPSFTSGKTLVEIFFREL